MIVLRKEWFFEDWEKKTNPLVKGFSIGQFFVEILFEPLKLSSPVVSHRFANVDRRAESRKLNFLFFRKQNSRAMLCLQSFEMLFILLIFSLLQEPFSFHHHLVLS